MPNKLKLEEVKIHNLFTITSLHKSLLKLSNAQLVSVSAFFF